MIIINFLLVFVFGYKLTGIFVPKSGALERLSLGYVLGIGIFTFVWFIINTFAIPITLFSATLLLVTLIYMAHLTSLLIRVDGTSLAAEIKYFRGLTKSEKIILYSIIFILASAFIGSLYWPVRHWDALTLYDFRARIFAETGFIMNARFVEGLFGYPLLTSLSHTLVYLSGFANPSFIYGLFYVSFVTALFTNLKKFDLSRIAVLLLTLLIAVSPRFFDHSLTAYTNLAYSIYLVLGSIYLYFGIKEKNLGAFLLSALLMGLTTWTRTSEPFWLSGVIVGTIYALANKKWLWPFLYVGVLSSIMMPWRMFKAAGGSGSANVVGQVTKTTGTVANNLQLEVIGPVVEYLMTNVFWMYFGYFAIFVLIIIYKIWNKSRDWLFVLLILANLGMLFAGTVFFSRAVAGWDQIPDSVARMMMFIPPMLVFILASELKSLLRR